MAKPKDKRRKDADSKEKKTKRVTDIITDDDVDEDDDPLPPNAEAAFEHGKKSQGDTFYQRLYRQNQRYRKERRELRDAEGVIVSEEELDELEAYKQLGPLDTLKDIIAKGQEAQNRLTSEKHLQDLRDVGKKAGFDADALFQLAPNAKVIAKDLKNSETGEEVTLPFALVKEGEGDSAVQKEVPLEEWIDSNPRVKPFKSTILSGADDEDGADAEEVERAPVNGKAGGKVVRKVGAAGKRKQADGAGDALTKSLRDTAANLPKHLRPEVS